MSAAIVEESADHFPILATGNYRAPKIMLAQQQATDGHIEISYPKVFSYSFQSSMAGKVTSHGDWRYDEFRVSERGHLIHEIEWAGAPGAQGKSFSWIIEADDIDFRWISANLERR